METGIIGVSGVLTAAAIAGIAFWVGTSVGAMRYKSDARNISRGFPRNEPQFEEALARVNESSSFQYINNHQARYYLPNPTLRVYDAFVTKEPKDGYRTWLAQYLLDCIKFTEYARAGEHLPRETMITHRE